MNKCYWCTISAFILMVLAVAPSNAMAASEAKSKNLSFSAFDADFTGALAAIVLHEAGHAVIDVLDPIVTGREEDIADEFAIMLLLAEADRGDTGAIRAVHAIATTFMAFWQRQLVEISRKSGQRESRNQRESEKSTGTLVLSPKLFVGEHSLDVRRANNFLCMLAGADPGQGVTAAIRHRLKVDRRWLVKCSLEYGRKRRNWKRILAPFRPKEKTSSIIIPKGLYMPGIVNSDGSFSAAPEIKFYFGLPPLPTDRPVFKVRDHPIKRRVGRYYERSGKLVSIIKQAALLLSHRINLPHDIPIDIRNCGVAGASYSRIDKQITMCREFFHRLADHIVHYETGLTFDVWAKQQKVE